MDLSEQAAGVGALADDSRRALYEYVVARPEPVGREEAARALDLPLHTVSFHLDRLVDVGLLTTEYRRLSGRTGPGAGRPSKLYRRAEQQWTVSLPDRRYELVGRILAQAVTTARSGEALLDDAVTDAATRAGREAGRRTAREGDPVDRLVGALGDQGYEPRVDADDGAVLLANCPFDVLAQEHTELVCGLNQCYVQGVAEGVGCTDVTAHLEPEPGLCCVKARRDG